MHLVLRTILVFILLISSAYTAEGMPQFNAKTFPSQLFWLVVSFLVLYLFITFLVLPRIRENIRLRKNKISNDIERASNLRDQTEKMVGEYNKKINDAKVKATDLIKNASKKANEDMNSQLIILKKQIEKKLSNAEIELGQYKKKALDSITESADSVALTIMKKLFSNNSKEININELMSEKKRNIK